VTIWVVRHGDDLYIRSYRGPSGSWFRRSRERPEGRIQARGVDEGERGVPRRRLQHVADDGRGAGQGGERLPAGADVEPEHHAGRQHPQQRLEVALPGGGQERAHRAALGGPVTVGPGGGADPAAGPAGQLPGRDLRAADDLADLVELDDASPA
jgi:hypothetical protein